MNNINNMNMWKWSIGDVPHRSARVEQKKIKFDNNINENAALHQSLSEEAFFSPNSSLLDQGDGDLISITNTMFSRNQNASGTRREDLDLKIADREMIAQRGVNPFMQTSYVNDVVAQDMFMKPINTTFGRASEE